MKPLLNPCFTATTYWKGEDIYIVEIVLNATSGINLIACQVWKRGEGRFYQMFLKCLVRNLAKMLHWLTMCFASFVLFGMKMLSMLAWPQISTQNHYLSLKWQQIAETWARAFHRVLLLHNTLGFHPFGHIGILDPHQLGVLLFLDLKKNFVFPQKL